jgi:hypothetical protein
MMIANCQLPITDGEESVVTEIGNRQLALDKGLQERDGGNI